MKTRGGCNWLIIVSITDTGIKGVDPSCYDTANWYV
jgi:hypothetical protein